MNNRIIELLAQCTDQHMTKPWPLIDAEKLAELIVRECADVAFKSDLTMAIGQWGSDSAILKHFGIEK